MFWVVTARLAGAIVAVFIGIVQRILHQRKIAAELHILSTHGITEERFVKIGGIQQWIGIRGEDQENPILLIVHGWPGSPRSIFTPRIRPWEKYFTCSIGPKGLWQNFGPDRTRRRGRTDNGSAGRGRDRGCRVRLRAFESEQSRFIGLLVCERVRIVDDQQPSRVVQRLCGHWSKCRYAAGPGSQPPRHRRAATGERSQEGRQRIGENRIRSVPLDREGLYRCGALDHEVRPSRIRS
jgi:hypothetical protein